MNFDKLNYHIRQAQIPEGDALNLPKGWEIKKFGEVYDVRDGTHDSPKYVKEGYALITSKNLKNDSLNYDKVKYITEQDYININKRSKVDIGDILFAMIGTIGNPIVIKNEPDFAIKNVALFKVSKNQDSYFLKYYLDSSTVIDRMFKDAKGATQKFVGLGYLRNFKIPLPPLPEQQRIVSILDEAFAAIDKAKANAEQNLKNAKELFESYLQGVFENKGEGWEKKTLGEMIEIKNGKNQQAVLSATGQYKVMGSAGNVMGYAIDFICEAGTTIIGRKGNISKPIYIEERFWNVDTAFGFFPKNEKDIDKRFVHYLCLGIDFKSMNRGTTIPSLVKSELQTIQIAFPKSLKTQQTIVQKLDALNTETKKLESIYQQKINDLEELKKSVLQKAFAGELKVSELGWVGLKDDKIKMNTK
jgi:type I restriction enzyme S subunit